jgi:hypothetical protein
MLKNDVESAIDHFLINIDPLRINNKSKDPRKWNSTFDVTVQSGLRWNKWKLLTGNPEPNNYPTGNIYPPEWPKNTENKLQVKSAMNLRLFNLGTDPFEKLEVSNDHKVGFGNGRI